MSLLTYLLRGLSPQANYTGRATAAYWTKTNESNFRVVNEEKLNQIGSRLKNTVRKSLTHLQQGTGLCSFNFEICRVSKKELTLI
jgi:SMC interacting uncharacterized protein involved in chromosome segregation